MVRSGFGRGWSEERDEWLCGGSAEGCGLLGFCFWHYFFLLSMRVNLWIVNANGWMDGFGI